VAEEACFSLKDLAVNGKDLMKELGLKPGKKIGAILQQMLEAVINETVTNNRDELLSLAQKLI
jgi:tRNA nucleotidyltransferase (CCA-adding enzyme)